MATLTEQQAALMKGIPPRLGADPYQPDWMAVLSPQLWAALIALPSGLVETHQKFAPIIGPVLGIGFARLTDAGRSAIAERGEG